MAPSERRNLYRILYVQPEAPSEVIKAAYRALMTTMRAHPDLGGGHDEAARLNAAYAVLSDPQRRAAYDQSLRRPARFAVPPKPQKPSEVKMKERDPQFWHLERSCPFCGQAFVRSAAPEPRCHHCNSPLTPAPNSGIASAELLGRRQGERFERSSEAVLRVPGHEAAEPARLKDLSLTGLSMYCRPALEAGSAFHISAPGFEAVAAVVSSRAQGSGHTVHARLLTLQLMRSNAGTFVSTKA